MILFPLHLFSSILISEAEVFLPSKPLETQAITQLVCPSQRFCYTCLHKNQLPHLEMQTKLQFRIKSDYPELDSLSPISDFPSQTHLKTYTPSMREETGGGGAFRCWGEEEEEQTKKRNSVQTGRWTEESEEELRGSSRRTEADL